MIKMVSLKCPECGADLSVEGTRKECFCQYCGAKIILTNENEYVYRHIDEAKIKQVEIDQAVKMKKLDLIERKRTAAENTKKIKIIISIIMGIVGLVSMIVGFGIDGMGTFSLVGMLVFMGILYIWILSNNKDDDDDLIYLEGIVKVPSSIENYTKKNYSAIEALFLSAGFTDVKCIPLNDLSTSLFTKPGMVKEITINGKSITSGGKKFSPDATVIITYHSLFGKS